MRQVTERKLQKTQREIARCRRAKTRGADWQARFAASEFARGTAQNEVQRLTQVLVFTSARREKRQLRPRGAVFASSAFCRLPHAARSPRQS